MISVEVKRVNEILQVNCRGSYGLSTEDNLACGRLVRDAIQRSAEDKLSAITTVMIDFTRVDYRSGDGPIWSVMGAVRRGWRVTYLVTPGNRESLECLFATTRMNRLIHLAVVADEFPQNAENEKG